MDTYGHLLPDQHADAVSGMATMMNAKKPLAATGPGGREGAVQGAVGMPKSAKQGTAVRAAGEIVETRETLDFPRKTEDD